MENLLKCIVPKTLLTLSFYGCERASVKRPIPRRKPPFLDGIQWHDLIKEYLPSTMKRFYIDYIDVDNTMSLTNPARVKKEFMEYNGSNISSELSFSYDKDTKLMSFDLTFIYTNSIETFLKSNFDVLSLCYIIHINSFVALVYLVYLEYLLRPDSFLLLRNSSGRFILIMQIFGKNWSVCIKIICL
jgi:hypothetical protein